MSCPWHDIKFGYPLPRAYSFFDRGSAHDQCRNLPKHFCHMWYKTLDPSSSHFLSKFYKPWCLELFYFHYLPEMTWRIFSDQEWCLLRKFSLEYWLCFNFSISASLPEFSYYYLSTFNTRRLKYHFICSTRKVQGVLRNCRINILLTKNKSWQIYCCSPNH